MHADQERVLAIYGRIFHLEDLRRMAGLIPSTPEASPGALPRNVVLVGHDCESDFEKTATDIGFSLSHNDANIIGVADTKWLAEEAGCDEPGLSKLAAMYKLSRMKTSKPKFKLAKEEFEGAHNAGNDAVMALEVLLATIFDRDLFTPAYDGCEVLDEPLQIDPRNLPEYPFWKNVIFIAIDLECREHDPRAVTEVGLAWLDLAEVSHLVPGDNGAGWHCAIHARHFMAEEWKGYRCKYFTVGNPWGFWRDFGRTEVVSKQGIAFRLGKQFRDFSQIHIIPRSIVIPAPASSKPAKLLQSEAVSSNQSDSRGSSSEANRSGSQDRSEQGSAGTDMTASLDVRASKREPRDCGLCGKQHVDLGIASVEWDHYFWVRLSLSSSG